VTVTEAPGIRAPAESVTTPEIVPVTVWAETDKPNVNESARAIKLPVINFEQRRVKVNMGSSSKVVLKISIFV
jgi:hypothetical protein